MSSTLENDLDLEKLFLPSWAQEQPAGNRFEKYTGTEGDQPERRRGGPRGDSFGGGGGRGEGRPRTGSGPRPAGGGGGGGSRFGGGQGDRRKGGPGAPRRDDRGGDRPRFERPEPPAPLPDLGVTFVPVEHGVESLARQIRVTGRAYPLFQIAQLVLDKPERYSVQLAIRKNADGTPKQALFSCALDDTPWLSEDEAVAHVLKNHFATFYTAERTPTEPPKGVYTFVAQCGLSGVILGPPNHHDYQNQLHKLHTERFSRMPFEVFKSRVKIVRDEAVVKKWVEDQSFRTEYVCLNVPEPLRLPSMEEVEKHFRAVHKDAIIKSVDTYLVAGVPSRNLRCRELQRLIRSEWEQHKHFPLPVATSLSRSFAAHGLHFFKVNKTVTHVAVARPQYLDLDASPVSENIKRIVNYINEHPKCSRRKMVETLAPAPTIIEIKPASAQPVAAPAAETPAAETPAAEGQPADVKPAAPKPNDPKSGDLADPTPEQTALIVDLHWLVHQGHVLEFADGKLETAKKPVPKPPKPEPKAPVASPATAEAAAPAATPTATEVPAAATEAKVEPVASAPAGEPAAPAEVPVADVTVAPDLADSVPASVPEAAASAAPVIAPEAAAATPEPAVTAPPAPAPAPAGENAGTPPA